MYNITPRKNSFIDKGIPLIYGGDIRNISKDGRISHGQRHVEAEGKGKSLQ